MSVLAAVTLISSEPNIDLIKVRNKIWMYLSDNEGILGVSSLIPVIIIRSALTENSSSVSLFWTLIFQLNPFSSGFTSTTSVFFIIN